MSVKLNITRRGIGVSLGLLWLLDGLLQLQRQMFTSNFANLVISPAAAGQPRVVNSVMHLAIRVFLLHPAVFDSLIALTQSALGVLILYKKTSKLGLTLSVFWGAFVWYVGEGLGGLLSGHTLILMGAPGAALIYALLALGVLPRRSKSNDKQDVRPAYWLAFVWLILWLVGAIYQLLPGQNTVTDVGSMISANAPDSPGWLASLDIHISNWIYAIGTKTTQIPGMHMSAAQMASMTNNRGGGAWFILLLAVVQASVGLLVLFPGNIRKTAITIGIVFSLVVWLIGQNLGGLTTGLATDPNSGPLFILLGVAIMGTVDLDFSKVRLAANNFYHRLEDIIT